MLKASRINAWVSHSHQFISTFLMGRSCEPLETTKWRIHTQTLFEKVGSDCGSGSTYRAARVNCTVYGALPTSKHYLVIIAISISATKSCLSLSLSLRWQCAWHKLPNNFTVQRDKSASLLRYGRTQFHWWHSRWILFVRKQFNVYLCEIRSTWNGKRRKRRRKDTGATQQMKMERKKEEKSKYGKPNFFFSLFCHRIRQQDQVHFCPTRSRFDCTVLVRCEPKKYLYTNTHTHIQWSEWPEWRIPTEWPSG